MRRFHLLPLFLCAVMATAQHPIPDPAEFTSALQAVLASAKIGEVPSAQDPVTGKPGPLIPVVFLGHKPEAWPKLPGAVICNITAALYRCEWEAVPNQYSPAVLQDQLSELVAASIPSDWKRRKKQDMMTRYSEFTSPAGDIAITISSQMTIEGLLPSNYGVRLTIHSPKLNLK